MEDGNFFELEVDMGQTIPTESCETLGRTAPSYIRGVNISTGEYITFDDNTKPPDFSTIHPHHLLMQRVGHRKLL